MTVNKTKILVVDDEAIQHRLIRDVLETSDDEYELHEVNDGIEAIQFLQKHSVDVVLIDKRMPHMNGDEVCSYIRNTLKLPLLPLIMVTGSNSSEELKKSFAAGANDFVTKPYRPIELIARLNNAVKNKRLTDQLDNADTLLFALARMVEAKDLSTGNHCSRLSHMGVEFGRALGLPEHELDAIRRGGVLHDIGKLGIPDSILLKEGPLDDDEWLIMRSHTIIGGHLCESLTSMRDVVPIILHHHERWDGSGYPYGLVGEEIPFLARVFQIVDIYDALSSKRPYKPLISTEEIIDIFKKEVERGWREPKLVAEFLSILKNQPERLAIPSGRKHPRDEQIFKSIAATGAINWDHSNGKSKDQYHAQ